MKHGGAKKAGAATDDSLLSVEKPAAILNYLASPSGSSIF